MTLSSRIEALEAACLPKEMTTIQIVTVSVDAHGVEQVLSVESLETPAPADDLLIRFCLLYTSPSPRDRTRSRMPSSA